MATLRTTHIVRRTLTGLAAVSAAGWIMGAPISAGQAAPAMPSRAMPMAAKTMMTKEQKIASAITAAPAVVSARATILDWPAKDGEPPMVLRAGNNGWSCLPDMPGSEGNDPMCVDKSWMQWVEAYTTHTAPHIATAGIGYMMAPGGGWGSNTDPYAMSATADNQWHLAPPHLMILVPDLKSLAGMPTDPDHGGPYVMYPGTPYAHIMAPLADAPMHAQHK